MMPDVANVLTKAELYHQHHECVYCVLRYTELTQPYNREYYLLK